jgi:hypothetical protein
MTFSEGLLSELADGQAQGTGPNSQKHENKIIRINT